MEKHIVEEDSLIDNERRNEIQETLAPRLISEPLKSKIDRELSGLAARSTLASSPTYYEVIIEVNLNNPQGRIGARAAIFGMLQDILG
ncbi:MAG: hypothetical protein H0X25_22385, partial [Acidobacteriales bacterium]|nr:hypothetical protein [Terriglobales bacterium]